MLVGNIPLPSCWNQNVSRHCKIPLERWATTLHYKFPFRWSFWYQRCLGTAILSSFFWSMVFCMLQEKLCNKNLYFELASMSDLLLACNFFRNLFCNLIHHWISPPQRWSNAQVQDWGIKHLLFITYINKVVRCNLIKTFWFEPSVWLSR